MPHTRLPHAYGRFPRLARKGRLVELGAVGHDVSDLVAPPLILACSGAGPRHDEEGQHASGD
jgi:hypothetical protein